MIGELSTVGLGASVVGWAIYRNTREWRRMGAELGLQRTGWWRFEGRVGAHQVLIRRTLLNGLNSVQIVVDGRETITHDLALIRESDYFTENDLKIGDDEFDRAVNVHGPELDVFALLDERTRAGCRRVVREFGGRVFNGVVSAHIYDHGRAYLTRTARQMIETADLLAGDVPAREQRLLDRLASNEGTRALVAVFRVAREKLSGEMLERAKKIALEHPNPSIRLRAADEPNTESIAVLRELVDDTGCADAVRAHALSRLAKFSAAPAELDPLCTEAGPKLLGVLVQLGIERAEDLLMALADTELVAVETLGIVGTHRSVAALHHAAEKGRSADVRRAAEKAIAMIHHRIGPSGGGRLSIADTGDGGALSLSVSGGELSFDDE